MIVPSNRRLKWWSISPFIFFFFCCNAESVVHKIVLRAGAQDVEQQIGNIVAQPFVLENLTYESDVHCSAREFFYLVDLQEGSTVDAAQLATAVSYLFKKNKFERIELTVQQGVAGMLIHMRLFGFWTFSKLKFHGITIGQEKYRQHYLLEPGQPFDEKKHVRSLERIREAFKSEGYFLATLSDQLVRDRATKSIAVHLTLNREHRFKIGTVSVDVNQDRACTKKKKSFFDTVRLSLSKKLVGKHYSKTLINKEIKELKSFLANKGFLHVGVMLSERVDNTRRRVALKFTLKLLEKRVFVFFGNSFFSDAQLRETALQFGRSSWLVPATVLAEEIERRYRAKGFWAVTVDAREECGRAFFLINEGVRASIQRITLKGVHEFAAPFLIKHCLKTVLRQKLFDQERLKRAVGKLFDFYNARGFWDVQEIKREFHCIDKQKQWYTMDLVIDEGEKTVLASITIPAFPELLEHHFFAKYHTKDEPVLFNPGFVREQRDWLKEHFQKQGYLHVVLKPNVQRDGSNVSVQWDVDLGTEPVTFGKTILLGSSTFPFERVLKELCYKEGELWSREKLKWTLDRLRAYGVFDRIHLYPERCDPEYPVKSVLLKLHKDDPIEVRFRAGVGLQQVSRNFAFGNGFTYKVGGSIIMKNPLNVGDHLFADVDFARAHQNVSFEYVRPQLFGRPLTATSKAYANRYEQPGFVGSKRNLYEVIQQGVLCGIRNKGRWFDIGGNVGFEFMRTSVKHGFQSVACSVARAINFYSPLLGRKIPYLFVEPILLIDCLDDKLNPSGGTFTLVTVKAMLPLGHGLQDAHMIKLLVEQSFFHTIGPIGVGALHFRIGHIFYQRFENIMPFERFYLGGANSIRSYEADMCPPLGYFKENDGSVCPVPQGGKTMVQLNAELRLPLFKKIGVVLFQDLGTLIGQSLQGMELSDLLAATGFGVRYNTPVGPLRFDIGWKWRVSAPHEYSYAWFLTLGHAF